VSPSVPTPSRITLRAYQVGFGDCFLLTFGYRKAIDGRAERHVLIDFGSTRFPKGSGISHEVIAKDISERTEKLDAVVVTHRHKDHLSGFGSKPAAKLIAELKPDLVVRPWTEDPGAAARAKAPGGPAEKSRRFVDGLDGAQEFARTVSDVIPESHDRRSFRGQLRHAAEEQLANQTAVEMLEELGKSASIGPRFVYAGADSGLGHVLPGVDVRVLGPPTVEQWPEVAGQRADDPDYWINQRGLLERMLKSAKTAEDPAVKDPTIKRVPPAGPVRWIVEKMADQHAHSLLRIVRSLDDALNNTSIILQFTVRGRGLLFPGDAQIENWSYVLDDPKRASQLKAKLDRIDLYKVGHHGSRNATPKSLYRRWEEGRPPFVSVMSTMEGVHGESKETRVPQALLTEALTSLGPLYRTDALEKGKPYVEISASTSSRELFKPT